MSNEFRAITRVGFGEATYKDGMVETAYGRFNATSINVDSVLSIIAACFARSIVEKLNIKEVSVRVELQEDLDALLDGDVDKVESLKILVKVANVDRDAIEKALAGCPFYGMLRGKVRALEVVGS